MNTKDKFHLYYKSLENSLNLGYFQTPSSAFPRQWWRQLWPGRPFWSTNDNSWFQNYLLCWPNVSPLSTNSTPIFPPIVKNCHFVKMKQPLILNPLSASLVCIQILSVHKDSRQMWKIHPTHILDDCMTSLHVHILLTCVSTCPQWSPVQYPQLLDTDARLTFSQGGKGV